MYSSYVYLSRVLISSSVSPCGRTTLIFYFHPPFRSLLQAFFVDVLVFRHRLDVSPFQMESQAESPPLAHGPEVTPGISPAAGCYSTAH